MANSTILSQVTFNGSIVATVQSAAATSTRPTTEVTEIGDGYAKFLYGVMNTTASLELFFSKSDHADLTTQMKDAGGAVEVVLTWDSGQSWTGNAYVTSANVTAAAGDVVKASVEIQFTGEVLI